MITITLTGPAASGKTILWNLLRKSLSDALDRDVLVHRHLNADHAEVSTVELSPDELTRIREVLAA